MTYIAGALYTLFGCDQKETKTNKEIISEPISYLSDKDSSVISEMKDSLFRPTLTLPKKKNIQNFNVLSNITNPIDLSYQDIYVSQHDFSETDYLVDDYYSYR